MFNHLRQFAFRIHLVTESEDATIEMFSFYCKRLKLESEITASMRLTHTHTEFADGWVFPTRLFGVLSQCE